MIQKRQGRHAPTGICPCLYFKQQEMKVISIKALLAAAVLLAALPAKALTGYSVSMADFELRGGETKKVELSMDNATEVSALSLEMRLPQGFSVGLDRRGNPAVTQTDRAYDQMLKANVEGQVLKVATLSNEAYDGTSGAVLVVPIVASETVAAGTYTINIYNVKFSSPAGKLYDVGSASCRITVPATMVETVTLPSAEETLRAGETLTLTPTVLPANATTKALEWTTDNADVATVDNGVVTGVSVGEANITATATDGSGASATCKVTVTPGEVKVASIALSPTEATVEAGHKLTLTATVLPADATNQALTWRSSSRDIATVADGVVTTLKAGSVTITAETTDGTALKAYCTLTVTAPAAVDYLVVDDFTANPGKTVTVPVAMVNQDEISAIQMFVEMPEGVSVAPDKRGNPMVKHDADRRYDQQLKATVDGQTLKIATLSNEAYNGTSGTLLTVPFVVDKSVRGGAYTFNVTNAKLSTPAGKLIDCDDFSFTMTVEEIRATAITLDQTEASVEASKTLQLAATVAPDDATVTAVEWRSGNEAVATVDQNGLVTAVATGQTVITATTTDGTALTAECALTVTDRVYVDYFVVDDFSAGAGSEVVMPIGLVNADEIAAVQLRVELPEGVSVALDKRGNPMVKHDADRWYDQQLKAVLDGQTLKIATLSNEAYNDNAGTLLNVTLTVAADIELGDYPVRIVDAKLSTPAGRLLECPDTECVLTVDHVSGVADVDVAAYTVYGEKGQLTIRGAEGQSAEVIAADGRQVTTVGCLSECESIAACSGVYLVHIKGKTTKVIVY